MAPTPTAQPPLPVLPGDTGDNALADPHAAEEEWRAAYLAAGGPPEYYGRLERVILTCESSEWGGQYANGYVSRAQFNAGTWATITTALGPLEPTNPLDVWRAVGYWVGPAGVDPAGTGGWMNCWRIVGG